MRPSFSLSLRGGAIKYFDVARVWGRNSTGRLPTSVEAVVLAVQRFFGAVNESVEGRRAELGIPAGSLPIPFPATLDHVSSYPMVGAGARLPDHWISTWMLHLVAVEPDSGDVGRRPAMAPVYGGLVEVRVGPGSQIVGLVSAIRPWQSAFWTAAFERPHGVGQRRDHRPKRDERGRIIPDICYVLDAPSGGQALLAPFFGNVGGHHHGSRLRPACDYSLIVDIAIAAERGRSAVTLGALVIDERGEPTPAADARAWRSAWLFGRMDERFELPLRHAHAPQVRLEGRGVYHVELTVQHIPTGASRSTHRQVIVGGERESSLDVIA